MSLKRKAAKKYRAFDFGVSYRVGETRDRFKDASNVFSNQGRLETRFGRSKYNATLLGGPVLSMSYFKTAAGVRYILAKVGTTLYSIAATGAHTAIKTGLSAGSVHRGITWARGSSSRHIIAIENDGLFQWDGTTFTVLGQDPPEGHSITTTTGTITAGNYRVQLTYYSSSTGFETNASFSNILAVTAQGILIHDIPATALNATIDKIRVYLEAVGTADDPSFIAEIALGTTTYTVAQNATSSDTRPISNAKPVSGGAKYLTEFNHKLVYAGNNNFKNDVFFSESDLPDAFNDGTGPDRLVLYAGGNGEITGIATGLYNNTVLDPYLVIFKKRSIEVYSEIGDDSKSVVISSQIGCVSHNTITVKNGNVYFLSEQGWRVIENGRLVTDQSGNAITLGLGDIDDIFRQPGFTYEVNKAQANTAFSVYYSMLDQYLTWVPEGGSTDLTKTYCFEFKTGGFKPYEFKTPSTAACTGEDSAGAEVVFMGDQNGAIYTHSIKEEKGSDADSAGVVQPVSAFALIPWIDGDDNESSYNWRELILKRVLGSGHLEVRGFVNYSTDSFSAPLLFESADKGFVLDVSLLDVDALLEEGRSIETRRADINQCGENLMLGLYQNEIGSSLGLISAQIEYNKNGNRN
jgi:hypothetical protein